jgi:hypothetical protein
LSHQYLSREFPFNSLKVKQFLESMNELKQFHFYALLPAQKTDDDIILSQFKSEYWLDPNLFFGIHENYFFTLPFHLDYPYDFSNSFDNIKSNN